MKSQFCDQIWLGFLQPSTQSHPEVSQFRQSHGVQCQRQGARQIQVQEGLQQCEPKMGFLNTNARECLFPFAWDINLEVAQIPIADSNTFVQCQNQMVQHVGAIIVRKITIPLRIDLLLKPCQFHLWNHRMKGFHKHWIQRSPDLSCMIRWFHQQSMMPWLNLRTQWFHLQFNISLHQFHNLLPLMRCPILAQRLRCQDEFSLIFFADLTVRWPQPFWLLEAKCFEWTFWSTLQWTYLTMIFMNNFWDFAPVANQHNIACSPCCGEYSRLKLEPGPGPKPLRSPEHLGGLPGLSMNETIRLQDSFLQLSRGVNCLQAGYCSGSYGHLEQPPNPMSWEEEVVQAFLTNACKVCINLPACQYDLDVHKAWLFKSTLEALASMGGVCNHPQGFHKSIVGTRDEHGNFQSKQTAQYPKVLAETFAKIVGPLISGPSGILTLQDAMALPPA